METNASGSTQVIVKNEEAGGHTDWDDASVKKAIAILRAVNHKRRLKLVTLIEDRKRINVTDIYVKLRLSQSITSQLLAILRKANIVMAERDGGNIYYSLNHDRIEKITTFVNELAQGWSMDNNGQDA